jgi:hypothetical protein
MFDELGRLAADEKIMQLLSHYGDLGAENREIWHLRLRTIEGIDERGLVRLHGTLIAYGWVEQNTGGPSCAYRITTAGQRALRRVRAGLFMDEDLHAEAA